MPTFFFSLLLVFATQSPPQKKPFMLPEKPQVEMSFTDMLNASDDISISTPGNHYSRRSEPDSLDDALFSPAQISLTSGTTSTSITGVEDTGTTSPAYILLGRQYYASKLELTILKREHHRLQYVLSTKESPKMF